MPAPKDPFANTKLSGQVGLDQRLFAETRPPSVPPKERSEEGPDERTKERTVVPKKERPAVRPSDAPFSPKPRTVEHRPYDFFSDQVRWLNRTKLDIDERYGKRIPATAMVQLAVDLLIADFEADSQDSYVIRVLLKDEDLRAAIEQKLGHPTPDTKEDG
jgi:hypothetical protein